MPRVFRPTLDEPTIASGATELRTDLPVGVYYRQSTFAQVGNISTAIQTIDMKAELQRKGWSEDRIILIDEDEGVSGTKRIDERVGMSELFQLIVDARIRTVACQDEDRLFRDVTQIQVNIFIQACLKANVQVVTPSFIYDFAHPQQGDYHMHMFRYKCEMAADYIKSYILGRLVPAKRRLAKEGKWFGAKMPVGYMVDMRKFLPDGSENPNWRKFVIFEPYAEIVRQYFYIFLETGGNLRKTLRIIRSQRLSFPDCAPPDGFKISYQLKRRGDGYYPLRNSVALMLTNPVYMGHWSYKHVVLHWNDHEPIIPGDIFLRAFNYLSKYTFMGDENKAYQPKRQYSRPDVEETRPVERPLCVGLIYSRIETLSGQRWVRAGTQYQKKSVCYLYQVYGTEGEGAVREWERHADWIDGAVVSRFKVRLRDTFKLDAWQQAITDDTDVLEGEKKIKRAQLATIDDAQKNLIASVERATSKKFVQDVQQRYEDLERERERLLADIQALEQRKHEQVSHEQAVALFEEAHEKWDDMDRDARRNVLAFFIDSIEASDYNRSGDMRLVIRWRDGSHDEVQLWHKGHSKHWTVEKVEQLLAYFDGSASQLEIAAAFPDLKWYQIYNEIKKHRGIVRFTPSWLGKGETYNDYVASGGRKGKASGSYWRDEELSKLRKMVERQACQMEIMREFPYRRWVYIKERIKVMFGKGTSVPLSGISQRQTYHEYAQEQKTVNCDHSSEIEVHYF